MKKILSIALALVMILSLSTVVFADEQDLTGFIDEKIAVSKTYVVNGGMSPAETFTFEFVGVSYKTNEGAQNDKVMIPEIPAATISFEEINSNARAQTALIEYVEIDPELYNLGVYTYEVTEVAGNTAGVTYDDQTLYLVLTILRAETNNKHYVAAMHYESVSGAKQAGFTNEYDAGQLSVTKQITGNMADMAKEFEFTVTFDAPEGTVFEHNAQIIFDDARTYTVVEETATSATYTFFLGDDATATFYNLPAGTTYTVKEANEPYTSSWQDSTATGEIAASEEEAIQVTNTLTSEVDTGIVLESMPYILILAVVAGAAVLFTVKKREV